MNLTVIVQPQFEPVTLPECYKQLRLVPDHAGSPGEETHPDDDMLRAQIQAAREYVEKATRRALVQQTIRLTQGGFPSYCGGYSWPLGRAQVLGGRILLRRPPLIRVNNVRYWSTDNTLTTIDVGDYYVTDDQVPELRFGSGFAAPSAYLRDDALTVEYVAGYAPSGSPSETQADYVGNIPQTLRQAVLIGVQLQYDNLAPADREAFERMRESMLQTYRIQHV